MKYECWSNQESKNIAIVGYEPDRVLIALPAKIMLEDTSSVDVDIRDISTGGFMGKCASHMAVGSMIFITLPDIGTTKATVVWALPDCFGAQFAEPVQIDHIVKNFIRTPYSLTGR